ALPSIPDDVLAFRTSPLAHSDPCHAKYQTRHGPVSVRSDTLIGDFLHESALLTAVTSLPALPSTPQSFPSIESGMIVNPSFVLSKVGSSTGSASSFSICVRLEDGITSTKPPASIMIWA